MSYIDAAGDALRAELTATGHDDLDRNLFDLYALLVLVRGVRCTLEDVHDAWAIWTAPRRPEHRSLIPFDDLTADVQELDAPYRDAIVNAAARLADA